MISDRQQAANIRNAQKSTGPSTATGLARSSRNATTHGLTGNEALLESEDTEAFDRHMEAYRAEHRPANEQEAFYVVQMAEAAWRLRRVRKFESTILSEANPLNEVLKLSRYEAAIERSYYRALRELKQLHAVRRQQKLAAIDAYITGPIAGSNRVMPSADETQTAEITKRTHSQNRTPPPSAESLGLQDPEVERMVDQVAQIARKHR